MPSILFIEDDPNYLAMYKTKLEQEGFSFVPAISSEEAFAAIGQQKPDLILLDLVLINENGLDILAKLRDDPWVRNIPVVIFTNYAKIDFQKRASNLEVKDYVIKTEVTPAQMVEKIKGVLGKKENAIGLN